MEWLSVAEFQCKNKIHSAMKYALFKLNSGRHSWKKDLTIKMELLKLKTFLEELQRSWVIAKSFIEKSEKQ